MSEALWLPGPGACFDFLPSAVPSSNPDSNSDSVTPNTVAIFDKFPKLIFFSPRSI